MKVQRVERLRQRLQAQGWEAAVIMPGPNMFYLTGANPHISERVIMVIIPAEGEPWAFCPYFEAERIGQGAGVERLFTYKDGQEPAAKLAEAVRSMGFGEGVLGLEYRYMRLYERELLLEATGGALRYEDVGSVIAGLRMTKDEEELALMQKACSLADAGARLAQERIAPGVSEQEVAADVEEGLKKLGVQGDLHAMVASGPRSAIPHAGATGRVMQAGELVWLDLVVPYGGYYGDITRTYPVGKVSGEAEKIYRICLEAQAAARQAARPGISGEELDRVARDYITSHGYGAAFTHRTGHGLGLEVHEEPYIVHGNTRPLEPGMTFTIEPGIYVTGLGGVRIEDDVVLTADGCRSLTAHPRDLLT